ncbi:DUF2975 domain-containing protein [Tenacibaculum dicentrarchi]|nr:DUF2975 domain-containing protein [Tenacibaculum dicentrarchi]
MKKLNILRQILDALWILSIVLGFMLFIDMLFLKGTIAIDLNTYYKISTIDFFLATVKYLFYLSVLYLFKKIIKEFQQLNIFTIGIVKLFNQIGIVLVLSSAIFIAFEFLHQLYSHGKFQIELDIGYNLIRLCLGLFFMILSEVFNISKNLKVENDLTI